MKQYCVYQLVKLYKQLVLVFKNVWKYLFLNINASQWEDRKTIWKWKILSWKIMV